MQQWQQLKKQGHCNPNPREIFLQDFSDFVEKRIMNDEELIIRMDANDEDLLQSGFYKFHWKNNLVDVFTHIHLTVTPPAIYQRGQHRLDHIFIAPALIPVLKSTGFLPYNIPFSSDHSSAYVDFDKEILFTGETNNPLDSAYRNLMPSNPQSRENYCKKVKLNFKQEKIIEKVETLYNKVKSGNYNKRAV
eukprot:10014884-Ditylum_brightwellii.AAC.1